MRGGASRPRPPPPGMRRARDTGGAEPGGGRGGGRAAGRLCYWKSASLPPGRSHPAAPRGISPRHTVDSIGAGSEESICLSLAMGNISPFVSLDEVRYSAACHENTGAKWLPRPPPLSGGGRGAPGTLLAPGRAGAARPRREAGCPRQGGQEPGTAAPRSLPGDAGKPRPGAPFPARTSPNTGARWSTPRAGRERVGGGQAGPQGCAGAAAAPLRLGGGRPRVRCLPSAPARPLPGPAAKRGSASLRGRPRRRRLSGRCSSGSERRCAGQRGASREGSGGGSPRAPFESGGARGKFRGREAGELRRRKMASARAAAGGAEPARPGPAVRGGRQWGGSGLLRGTGGAERGRPRERLPRAGGGGAERSAVPTAAPRWPPGPPAAARPGSREARGLRAPPRRCPPPAAFPRPPLSRPRLGGSPRGWQPLSLPTPGWENPPFAVGITCPSRFTRHRLCLYYFFLAHSTAVK